MAYETEVLNDTPFLYWRMEETNGTTAADSSGNARDGTIAGSNITLGHRLVRGSGAFEIPTAGSDRVERVLSGFGVNSFTAEIWMKASSINGAGLISYASPTNSADEFALVLDTGTSASLYILGTQVLSSGAITDLADGQPHHVAIRWQSSDGTWDLLIDGSVEHTGTSGSGSSVEDGGNVAVAQRQSTLGGGGYLSPFVGYIDEFSLYSSFVSTLRLNVHIDEAYAYRDAVLNDSPFLFWLLDEVSGTTAADATANGRDGTIAGDVVLGEEGLSPTTGNAFDFNQSSTDGVVSRTLSGFGSTNELSVEFIIQTTTLSSTDGLVSYASPSSDNEFFIAIPSSNEIRVFMNPDGGRNLSAHAQLDDGNPHHVLVRWRSSDGLVEVWVDGLFGGNAILNQGGSIDDGGQLVIAQEQDTAGGGGFGQAFTGLMDSFSLYNVRLTDSQVDTHNELGSALVFQRTVSTTGNQATFQLVRGYDTDVTGNQAYITMEREIPSVSFALEQPPPPDPPEFYQRIYDTVLGQFVYYVLTSLTTTPMSAQTAPNHSGVGNLDASTHVIVEIR